MRPKKSAPPIQQAEGQMRGAAALAPMTSRAHTLLRTEGNRTMPANDKVYDQHNKAFSQVAAYAVLYDGKPVAKVAFQFAKSGLRTVAFVHGLGQPMTRGQASGGGYDKCSAAVAAAVATMNTADIGADCEAFVGCLLKDDGQHWDNRLRAAAFDVFQVI